MDKWTNNTSYHEKPNGLTWTMESREILYVSRVGSHKLNPIVWVTAHLHLDFLEVVSHGRAMPSPVKIDMKESSRQQKVDKLITSITVRGFFFSRTISHSSWETTSLMKQSLPILFWLDFLLLPIDGLLYSCTRQFLGVIKIGFFLTFSNFGSML